MIIDIYTVKRPIRRGHLYLLLGEIWSGVLTQRRNTFAQFKLTLKIVQDDFVHEALFSVLRKSSSLAIDKQLSMEQANIFSKCENGHLSKFYYQLTTAWVVQSASSKMMKDFWNSSIDAHETRLRAHDRYREDISQSESARIEQRHGPQDGHSHQMLLTISRLLPPQPKANNSYYAFFWV